MTPQERKLVDELFDRLASLEGNRAIPTPMRAINEGLQRAPNALYPLVQTALVQDEALKRADARIRELEEELGVEPGEPVKQAGFLDNMRDALLGKPQARCRRCGQMRARREPVAQHRGATGRLSGGSSPAMAPSPAMALRRSPRSAGGSFLGTAAATAAGVIGGALLMNSFRGMFWRPAIRARARSIPAAATGTPWGRIPRQRSCPRRRRERHRPRRSRRYADDGSQRAGLFDSPQDDDSDFDGGEIDVGGDFGGDGGSDSA